MFIDKYGYWQCGDAKFDDKHQALVYATQNNTTVRFHYHDDIWRNFDRSLLGKIPLPTLYKERAQQLRDNYDYLILYYSGGADSYNVLRSFVDNNIKLDEVCVKWPKPLTDGKFYQVNTVDKSAKNYWSEWDFAVKPSLEWLGKHHPDIKITIKDYVSNKLDLTNSFENLKNHGMRAGILLNSLVSDSEQVMLDQGKTVANIYGSEKPRLGFDGKRTGFFFSDFCFVPVVRSVANPTGAEPFYWTPDMPIIAIEQAYQMSLYYKVNPKQRVFMKAPNTWWDHKLAAEHMEIAKSVIYNNWDFRFQADKPTSAARLDKFSWFLDQQELSRPKDIFVDNVVQRSALISDKFLYKTEQLPSYRNFSTSGFYLETYND